MSSTRGPNAPRKNSTDHYPRAPYYAIATNDLNHWLRSSLRRACSLAATSRTARRPFALQPPLPVRRRWAGSARRATAGTAASRDQPRPAERSGASWRFRSWLRNRCAVSTSTPSWVSRRPARSLQPLAHALGQRRRAAARRERSWTAVSTLLTFCPPGPDEPHEAELLELALVQGDVRGDRDHGRQPTRPAPSPPTATGITIVSIEKVILPRGAKRDKSRQQR